MINVLHVITGLKTGGAESMLLKLLERLDRERYMPMVISLTTIGDIGPRIAALGIPVQALEMTSGLPSPSGFFGLLRQIRQFKPDIVHTWLYHADLLGGLAARLAGIRRVVWTLRQSNLSPHLNKRSTLLVVQICSWLSRWLPKQILSCSDQACRTHAAVGYCQKKMRVIPNGFDLDRFVPSISARESVRAEIGVVDDVQLVGLVARYDPQKNHLGFVVAASLIHKVRPTVHFLWVGAGVDKENIALSEAIAHANLQDVSHMLGRRDDMPRLMASLDVLVSPSHGEAFPNVIGEAMSCAVPCVVTDVGDSAEIVGDTGKVVPAGDMGGIARHVVDLLSLPVDARNAVGQLARDRVRTCYEIGEVVTRHEDFYQEILDGI